MLGQPTAGLSALTRACACCSCRTRGLYVEEALTFEQDQPGISATRLPEYEVPHIQKLGGLMRADEIGLPSLPEPSVMRHYVRLSQKNFSIDTNMYPLGSCTMKYNPRINEAVVRLAGMADVHPLQPVETVQGILEATHLCAEALLEITGMEAISMNPAAGAHGEHTGLMAIRQAHVMNGEGDSRTTILVPDSAHGTNPASAAACHFKVQEVASNPDGSVDMDDFQSKLGPHIAGFMLTNPSTLGMFEPNARVIADKIHEVGGFMYMDGANLNALLGRVRIADLGADVMHINLHKTFSTPHGAGGSGSGPLVMSKALARYIPKPFVYEKEDGSFDLDEHLDEITLGRVKQFVGQTGVILRALAYIWALGPEGLRHVSGDAVINANYLLKRLTDAGVSPGYPGRRCMHEAVFSDAYLRGTGVATSDIAKGLIDAGFHPPTMYFPLCVSGALLIEPTESETKQTLDKFVDVLSGLVEKAHDPNCAQELHEAPIHVPIRRCDEVLASKKPVLRV